MPGLIIQQMGLQHIALLVVTHHGWVNQVIAGRRQLVGYQEHTAINVNNAASIMGPPIIASNAGVTIPLAQ